MKKEFGKYLGRFSLVNLAAFLLFYISNYVIGVDAVEYVRHFIGEAVDFALPIVVAALVAIATVKHGFRALWLGVAAAIGRLAYLYPAMYLEFVGPQNLSSGDSLLVSFPFALGLSLVELIYSMLLVFLIHLVCEKAAHRRGGSLELAVSSASSAFDFSNELTLSVFIGGIVSFIINLAFEIEDAVVFLTEHGDSYQMSEIIFIAVSFVMILVELLLTQVVIFKIKNKIDEGSKEAKNADF